MSNELLALGAALLLWPQKKSAPEQQQQTPEGSKSTTADSAEEKQKKDLEQQTGELFGAVGKAVGVATTIYGGVKTAVGLFGGGSAATKAAIDGLGVAAGGAKAAQSAQALGQFTQVTSIAGTLNLGALWILGPVVVAIIMDQIAKAQVATKYRSRTVYELTPNCDTSGGPNSLGLWGRLTNDAECNAIRAEFIGAGVVSEADWGSHVEAVDDERYAFRSGDLYWAGTRTKLVGLNIPPDQLWYARLEALEFARCSAEMAPGLWKQFVRRPDVDPLPYWPGLEEGPRSALMLAPLANGTGGSLNPPFMLPVERARRAKLRAWTNIVANVIALDDRIWLKSDAEYARQLLADIQGWVPTGDIGLVSTAGAEWRFKAADWGFTDDADGSLTGIPNGGFDVLMHPFNARQYGKSANPAAPMLRTIRAGILPP